MTLNASDYAGRRRDSTWENNLAHRLRGMPESDKLDFIKDLLKVHEVVALEIARRCQLDVKSARIILEIGLKHANASSMHYWLRSLVHSFGKRRLIISLAQHRDAYPEGVARAMYWLPDVLGRNDLARFKAELDLLKDIASEVKREVQEKQT